jgi:hypothetical protein
LIISSLFQSSIELADRVLEDESETETMQQTDIRRMSRVDFLISARTPKISEQSTLTQRPEVLTVDFAVNQAAAGRLPKQMRASPWDNGTVTP